MKEGYIKAKYRKVIPCYYNLDTEDVYARNWVYDKLLDFFIWYDYEFNDGFYIWIEGGDK